VVIVKLGVICEGVLWWYKVCVDGIFCDIVVFLILCEEWLLVW